MHFLQRIAKDRPSTQISSLDKVLPTTILEILLRELALQVLRLLVPALRQLQPVWFVESSELSVL